MLVELKNSLSDGQLVAFHKEGKLQWQILQNDKYLWLKLDQTVQSVMDKADHNILAFPHQYPLRGLIAELPEQAKILEFGLGGGSNFRYIKSQRPQAQINIIEKSQLVIDWFSEYFNPDKLEVDIQQGDAFEFLMANQQKFDLIITDLFTAHQSLMSTFCLDYFVQLKNSITKQGYAYINFLPETDFEAQWIKANLNQAGLEVMWGEKIVGFRNWVFLVKQG
ncbi:spermidine synthase [Catenovulum sp. SX2]|uniref:spermidine synthase n=1 Tax=Catenovulum sp. SX2 TaxID=3398614 RepID=UPI003F87E0F6